MLGSAWIAFILALILFCFECLLLIDLPSVREYLVYHCITTLILAIYLYSCYLAETNLLFPLLLFITGLASGPFGLGAFLLTVLLRPIYSLFASTSSVWFEGLFPEADLTLLDRIIERISSRWDDYQRQEATSSFEDLLIYGSLEDKQKVLDAIVENFDPSYSPILRQAMQDSQNLVRIQAAALSLKLRPISRRFWMSCRSAMNRIQRTVTTCCI